ncbi:Lysophospholipase nte1 [Penicillium atrosanguineum]|uniref:Lysophospholipase nte1 n=1 Tax=Penicillium atrosanguineum TaxID=1132637 RepID=UPI00239A8053|nr:Lysophospholipase nte1 [Penicillium atrosanguineum]KAJ5296352.1 Lysophospholipase nte1 [Penicillium atrosanguineum]
MSFPRTIRAFRRTEGPDPVSLVLVTDYLPLSLKPDDVLIRNHAVSLNYRDVAMLHGKYPGSPLKRGIAASDCAAEVIAIGSEVTKFAVGDRVAPIFDLNNLTGTEKVKAVLGGDIDGVLRENVLVHLPKYLSWEEAATITCAGTTAWNALDMPGSSNSGKVALLQGKLPIIRKSKNDPLTDDKQTRTGGVSMFALQICLAAGIHPIITSSSDKKLEMARSLGPPGAVDTVNYRTHPDWENEVMRLTSGNGADIVIENVGPATIAQSLASLANKGTVSLIGFLGGFETQHQPETVVTLLMKTAKMQGIFVGSIIDQRKLCDFLEERQVDLSPIVDQIFPFTTSNDAFDYLYTAQHQSKVVIKF